MWYLAYDYLTDFGSKRQAQLPLTPASFFMDRIKASQEAEKIWQENLQRHVRRTNFKLIWIEKLVFYRPMKIIKTRKSRK